MANESSAASATTNAPSSTPTTVPSNTTTTDSSNTSSNTGSDRAGASRGGRGGGRGRGYGNNRSGRGGGRGSSSSNNNNNKKEKAKSKEFKGETSDMNGHVFQTFAETDNRKQWTNTLEALGRYINVNMTNSADLAPLHRELTLPSIEEPEAPEKQLDKDGPEMYKWRKKYDRYLAKQEKLEDNLQSIYSLAWGQCSQPMKARVQANPGYTKADKECDCVWLLKQIKGIMFKFEGEKEIFHANVEARAQLATMKQKESESTNIFLEQFTAVIQAFEHYGSSIGTDAGLIKHVTKEMEALDPGEYSKDTNSADELRSWIEKDRSFRTAVQKKSRDRALGMLFLFKSDRARYRDLWIDLQNMYSMGKNKYPKNLSEAYTLVSNFKKKPDKGKKNKKNKEKDNTKSGEAQSDDPPTGNDDEVEMNFLQLVAGTNGITIEDKQCYNCQNWGHYAHSCPERAKELNIKQAHRNNPPTTTAPAPTASAATVGTSLLQSKAVEEEEDSVFELMFLQRGYEQIPSHWILLDSQSTTCVFKNKAFLKNIRPSKKVLHLLTNGGTHTSNLIGDLGNFGPVWYNPDSLANILSLAAVKKRCRVTMDTEQEAAMVVHRRDGSMMKFKEFQSGLYYYDPKEPVPTNSTKSQVSDYCLIQTVDNNQKLFHRREVEGAKRARELHRKLGRPSQKRFEHILNNGLLHNCPVTANDARRALLIYGPNVATLKGSSVRTPGAHVPTFNPIALPPYILEHHRRVTLSQDIFYVEGITFYHSISRKIKFRTASHIPNRSKATLLKLTRKSMALYHNRGLVISDIHADLEFECLRREVEPRTKLTTFAQDDHPPEVERSIRTVKNAIRATSHGLPYKRIPKLMVTEIVYHAIRSLNQFPADDGISETMSPLGIVTGIAPPDYNKLKVEFGQYVQAFTENETTNDNSPRSVGAIALSSTPNESGQYKFMSLSSGKTIRRKKFTVLPVTQLVIDRVESIASKEGQPLIVGGTLSFEWGSEKREVADEDHVEDDGNRLHVDEDNEQEIQDDRSDESSVESNDQSSDADSDDDDDNISYDDDDEPQDDDSGQHYDSDDLSYASSSSEEQRSAQSDEEQRSAQDEDSDENQRSASDDEEQPESVNIGGYTLRGNRKPSHRHRLDWLMDNVDSGSKSYETQLLQHAVDMSYNLEQTNEERVYGAQFLQQAIDKADGNPNELFQYVTGVMFNQMSAKKGITKHGDLAIAALLKEFAQLDDRDVFKGLHASDLTPRQRREALRAINLIKEKRSGKLKGCTVADGSMQRDRYGKEETSSPTPANDTLMMSLIIDAMEGRTVGTSDIPGAYLNAYMDDFTVVKLTGESVDILCKMNPDYLQYVTTENGKKVLYLQLVKALYGCIKSALLWYKLFSSTLEKMEFEINTYDTCVANKIIDGKQCTIVWYVDDLKVSHVSESVVRSILKDIEGKFGKLEVVVGKTHNYLGMDITFTDDAGVEVWMYDHIMEAIEDCGEDVSKRAVTPATRELFEIDEESPRLDEEKGDRFHRVTAKLLYVSKRCRLDIQLAISFLSTRITKSTEQDWKKLIRVLRYLNWTKNMVLKLSSTEVLKMDVFIDASYGVHADMKGHTGGCVTFGRGAVMSKSGKQTLNTKSSTETEIVGCSDYATQPLWGKKFLEHQGYTLECDIHQDNRSAMRMEKNGRKSCGPKSRHIDIRYFWFHDRIEKGEFDIVHCPTHKMIADFFTKPLQGELFRRLRDVIMGAVDLKRCPTPQRSVLEIVIMRMSHSRQK